MDLPSNIYQIGTRCGEACRLRVAMLAILPGTRKLLMSSLSICAQSLCVVNMKTKARLVTGADFHDFTLDLGRDLRPILRYENVDFRTHTELRNVDARF